MKYKSKWKELEEKHPPLKTLRKSHVWPFPEIGEGWYKIIDEMMIRIKAVYQENNWDITKFEVHQVKEKFGGLRFYTGGLPEGVHDIIHEYENKSYTVCEECGEKGELRENLPWIRTLCDTHYAKVRKKYEDEGWTIKQDN